MRATKPKRGDSKQRHPEILKAAAPFLKKHGTDAPVDRIMKAAGLTSGALYSHFKNKDDLCNQVICDSLDATLARYRTIVAESGRDGLRTIVAEYLSDPHIRGVAQGCTFAALGADMAKASASIRRSYELRIQALVDIFVEALGPGPTPARGKALHVVSAMLGALTLARAMSDADAAAELLGQVRSNILAELDCLPELD